MFVVQSHTNGEREVLDQLYGRLVEQTCVQGRGVEGASHGHPVVLQGDGHPAQTWRNRREVGQTAVDDARQPVHALLLEGDGCFRFEPLVLEVDAAGPLPATIVLRLDGNLLAQHLAVLLLLQGEDVFSRVVLVHVHLVLQELEAGDAAHHDAVEVMLCLESDCQVVPEVVSVAVVGHMASIRSFLLGIGVSPLACPLVAG